MVNVNVWMVECYRILERPACKINFLQVRNRTCNIKLSVALHISARFCQWNCFKTTQWYSTPQDAYVIPGFNHIYRKSITFSDRYCTGLCQHWPREGDTHWSKHPSTYHLLKWRNAHIAFLPCVFWRGQPSLVDPRLTDFFFPCYVFKVVLK